MPSNAAARATGLPGVPITIRIAPFAAKTGEREELSLVLEERRPQR